MKQRNLGHNSDSLTSLMKDYNYSNNACVEIVELAVSKNIVKIVSFNVKDAYGIVSQEAKEKETILAPETQYDEISNPDDENTLHDTPIVIKTLINATVETQISGFRKFEKKFQRHIDSVEERLISTEDRANPLMPGGNKKVTPFCYHQELKG